MNGVANCPLGPKSPACTGGVDKDFTIVPDGAWYTIKPFFMHQVSDIATKLTLAHLKGYNMFHGFPVAPEAPKLISLGKGARSGASPDQSLWKALKLGLTEFGNQYNNFNAGKILLYLEGS